MTAPGEMAEVVTVSQNYRRETFYACTCSYELFTSPRADVENCCVHCGLVALFLALNVESLVESLERQNRWLRLAIRKQLVGIGSEAAIERRAARAGELQYWISQRRAATVLLIPRCVTEQQEAACAASTLAWLLRWPACSQLLPLDIAA